MVAGARLSERTLLSASRPRPPQDMHVCLCCSIWNRALTKHTHYEARAKVHINGEAITINKYFQGSAVISLISVLNKSLFLSHEKVLMMGLLARAGDGHCQV